MDDPRKPAMGSTHITHACEFGRAHLEMVEGAAQESFEVPDMPKGGNTYEKYQTLRRADGKLNLPEALHDAAVHLLAEGNEKEQIPPLLDNQITVQEIEALMEQPLAQRRLAYLKREQDHECQPRDLNGYMDFALKKLWKIAANGKVDDTVKIKACEPLGNLAAAFRKDKPSNVELSDFNPAMEKLSKLAE